MKNSIQSKIHLACQEPGSGSNKALEHILFDDGYALAANTKFMVAYDLTQDLDQEIIQYLHGKMMHIDEFAKIHGKRLWIPAESVNSGLVILAAGEDGNTNHHQLIGDDSEFMWPDWKSVLPWLRNVKTVTMNQIIFDHKNLQKMADALLTNDPDQLFTFKFFGPGKPIKADPVIKAGRSFAVIQPITIKQ